MRLPTSTVVMATVTCALFGMAIRATVTGTDTVADDDGVWTDDSVEAENEGFDEQEAAHRAELLAQLEKQERIQKDKLRTLRAELYGAEPATLGPAFAALGFGTPETASTESISSCLEKLEKLKETAKIRLTLWWTKPILSSVEIEEQFDDTCDLGDKLRETWGAGTTDGTQRYWVNPVTMTRASIGLGLYDCRLTVEQYATPQEWISKTRTSLVPLAAIGASVAKLQAMIGAPAPLENDHVRWMSRGVGTGVGDTRFEAYVENGKVVGLTATASTTTDTYEDIVAQLTALHGAPIEDEDELRWKSRPVIRLDHDDGAGVRVTVGTVP